MKFLVVLASVFLAVSAKSVSEQWQEFKLDHGKSYKSVVEETKRFAIFQDNLNKIEQHNVKYQNGESSFQMGVNRFADMTLAEFKAQMLMSNVTRPKIEYTKTFHAGLVNAGDIPNSIDWVSKGAVTEVKDQGDCGSCYAFGSVAAIEAAHFLKTGELINLSEQQIVDCSTINGGCDGGWSQAVYEYVRDHGLSRYEQYPYVAKEQSCSLDYGDIKVSSYGTLEQGEGNLKAGLASIGPLSIAIHAENIVYYSSGVFDDQTCTKDLDHEVLLVGYGKADGKDYWRIKNSWGKDWGEEGYIRLVRNSGDVCGVADEATYPILN